jgi:3',5'-cyclic AMP phosphodiesterase CpdA
MHDTTQEESGLPRRSALTCMLWAGTGLLWTVVGGIPRSGLLGGGADAAEPTADFTFVQISDSHIGFAKDPNTDTPGTLQAAIGQIRAAPQRPTLLLHTGDVSHLSKPAQFDTAEKIIGGAGLDAHYVPGEHDMLEEDGKPFIGRFQKGTKQGAPGGAFYGFDQNGVHFVALNNVTNLKAGGLGNLGEEQLHWLKADLDGRSASQPIVVFAHIPLWMVYESWGWGTEDGARVLDLLKPFGSVTILNGHIHQIMQKVEGNVAFHTARATAFPQPAPGTASSPGPMKVEPGRLRSLLGVTSVSLVPGRSQLAIVDTPLGA